VAEEAVAMQWRKGTGVRPGAVFTGRNESGSKQWSTRCTVTDAEPGRIFAFDVNHAVFPVARWRYDIVAADGGCRVTESAWDRRPGWFRKLSGKATGVPDRVPANTKNIELTLQRLKERAEAG
jgi:Polyketide cyclase / dehydrase and lipid transport